MGLSEKQIAEIKNELDTARNPVFIFDDDADGVCSFLLFYRYIKEGKGIVAKASSVIDHSFVRTVEGYDADKIFILDKPDVSQEFIDAFRIPIIWIDHHDIKSRNNVKYYNPKQNNPNLNFPTTYCCYQVVKDDIWIAMAGCIGDWHMPDFKAEFLEKYPELLSHEIKEASEALFNSQIGLLTKIIWFNLHGKAEDYKKSIRILTRIDDPHEILEQNSPKGKFIYKRFQQINHEYELTLNQIKVDQKDKLLFFKYNGNPKISFSAFLSNELLVKYPEKLIIIAREKDGEYKCSLRSGKILVAPILEKSLVGIHGTGGGHPYACGAVIRSLDFEKFIENIRKYL